MFYEPGKTAHGLPHDPFKSCVIPRPIGWISSVDDQGNHNLAPFSQFQNITFDPPIVMFAANQRTDGSRKHSTVNAETTHEFVWNMATYDLREAVNRSAQEVPAGVDEFAIAGLTKKPMRIVKACGVAESPVQFECRYLQTVRLPGGGAVGTTDVVFGQVVVVHIADNAFTPDGRIDVLRLRPIARLGYFDYTTVDSTFEMIVPDSPGVLRGLAGSASF